MVEGMIINNIKENLVQPISEKHIRSIFFPEILICKW